MSGAPLVSVVIPTHNSAKYVLKTAENILTQPLDDLELIVVDDGSSDNTPDVVEELVKRDPRVHLVRQKQQGLGGARNSGIAVAKGRYFTTVDADDLWAASKLERQVAALESSPPRTISLTGVKRFSDGLNGAELWSFGTRPPMLVPGPAKMARIISLSRTEMVVFNTAVFRIEDIVELGGWSREMWTAHDWELWLRAGRSFEFTTIDEPLMFYRKHHSSMTRLSDLDEVLGAHEALIEREMSLGTVSMEAARAALVERRLDRVMDLRYSGQLLDAMQRLLRLLWHRDTWSNRRFGSEAVDIMRAWTAKVTGQAD